MKISHEPTWALDRENEYPRIEGHMAVDTAIVGGGLTGLLSAYFLSEKGKKVAVLEAHTLGSGATLYTTAFITQVIDTRLSDLIKMFGAVNAKLIWQAGEHAIGEIEAIVKKEKIDCEFERCSAYIYASNEKEYKELQEEHRAAQQLGFSTELVKNNKLPFEHYGFLEVKNQAKFHPLKFLHSVAKAVTASGGKIFEHTEALSLEEGLSGDIAVRTAAGSVAAHDVIVTTYAPFNNPTPTKYKKGMYRSYVLEARIPQNIFADGLYWDLNNPYHYFRIDRQEKFDRMILGGEDHRAEFPISSTKSFDALREHLAGLLGKRDYEIVRAWTGPILEPIDGLPQIGAYKLHQFVATAFSGNGMTYAMVGAMIFRDLITQEKSPNNPWIPIFDPLRTFNPYRVAKKGVGYIGEFFGAAIKNTLRKNPPPDASI